MVHGIERDANGRVTGVVYRHRGIDRRQRCAALFVCAGGVETPRLLLHTGLANGSGQVGQNFMAHGATQVWGRFDAEMRGHRGYPSSLVTEDNLRPADADFAGGYLVQSLGVMPVTLATSMARSAGLWGQALVDAVDGYRFMAGVGINAECLPSAGNRLELSDELDAAGIPKAVVSFSSGANEQAIERHATKLMSEIVDAAGATRSIVLSRTAHTVGTCRMGTERESAVVDAEGRSFDIDNLWICDNSVFPSALVANPALTIMALSLRTAERFLTSR
jgi:choline dehydrogenase-like flavoprotein